MTAGAGSGGAALTAMSAAVAELNEAPTRSVESAARRNAVS
jgi:hypothetical protein